ncbi:MAG: 1-(5-phosphoribosyl)-5-[(5-phosphoribosylamino)methylideneamino]imidazole-4-carboxamide isomerase [Candidatus Omnitrophica bacterium]|nr:1-(5-phosphoribosyl)-5-[(5-phosphoribosylamino)methylideneamino]imidazole-4-carboxamide isomerase [Candidatus Omnitrophota bacterium]
MLIIPAIDLRSQRVVRLTQGDFTRETFYSSDPVEVAKKWESKGAKLLHMVDLDGALAGESKNLEVIEAVHESVKIPIQLGGGLRTDEAVERVLSKGVANAIIGTRAYADEDFVKRLVDRYRERIIVGIDAAGETVVSEGWTAATGIKAVGLAKKMESLGISTIVYTNVLRDGTLERPQFDLASEMLDAVNMNVIISGGISSIEDIKDLKALNKKNLYGIITGKALYEGRLDLEEAIKIAKE